MAIEATGVENVMEEVAHFWQLRKFQFIEEATDFWMDAVAPKACLGDEDPKQAAEDGDRGVLLCYTDCCSNAHAALAVLEGRGFTIVRRSENIGGVMQHPAYYAEW